VKRPYFIEESVGVVEGLGALYPENNLREILVKDLLPGIERIPQLDLEQATEYQLRTEAQWCSAADAKLERAEEAVEQGVRLLTQENLKQLIPLISVHSRKQFREFIAQLP
jgi:hypothetical protein